MIERIQKLPLFFIVIALMVSMYKPANAEGDIDKATEFVAIVIDEFIKEVE